jgi:hypothetical protein
MMLDVGITAIRKQRAVCYLACSKIRNSAAMSALQDGVDVVNNW